jgi:hypothetical protein
MLLLLYRVTHYERRTALDACHTHCGRRIHRCSRNTTINIPIREPLFLTCLPHGTIRAALRCCCCVWSPVRVGCSTKAPTHDRSCGPDTLDFDSGSGLQVSSGSTPDHRHRLKGGGDLRITAKFLFGSTWEFSLGRDDKVGLGVNLVALVLLILVRNSIKSSVFVPQSDVAHVNSSGNNLVSNKENNSLSVE